MRNLYLLRQTIPKLLQQTIHLYIQTKNKLQTIPKQHSGSVPKMTRAYKTKEYQKTQNSLQKWQETARKTNDVNIE